MQCIFIESDANFESFVNVFLSTYMNHEWTETQYRGSLRDWVSLHLEF